MKGESPDAVYTTRCPPALAPALVSRLTNTGHRHEDCGSGNRQVIRSDRYCQGKAVHAPNPSTNANDSSSNGGRRTRSNYFSHRSRSELPTTDSELRVMAALATWA